MKILPSKIVCLLFLLGANVYAAPTGPPPPGVPPPGLPIDGGLWLLAFAAILFAIYKMHKLQFNKKTPI